MANGIIDTAMAGHLSAKDLAAVAIGASVFYTVYIGLMGALQAISPIVAQHFGGNRPLDAGETWRQGQWMALALLLATLYIIDIYDERQIVQDPRIDTAKNVIIGISLVLTVIGFLIYVGEKKLDYKGKFDYGTLLLGTTKCQGTPNIRAYGDSLNAAFFMTAKTQMGGYGHDGLPMPPISHSFTGSFNGSSTAS